jgi:hypothetical protein
MSLVASYIRCKDNKWYKELVYKSKDGDWFLCFDDDDPPELVIKESCKKTIAQICEEVGISSRTAFNANRNKCNRMFNGKFHEAFSLFLRQDLEVYPTPVEGRDEFEAVFDKMPNCQGVFFGHPRD